MKVKELNGATIEELHAKLAKLDKVIDTHPQKSMRAKAGSSKAVILGELSRRRAESFGGINFAGLRNK